MSFEDVEERLVEALATWWRMPDADARYGIGGRISSIWSQYVADPLPLIDRKPADAPRPPRPSRADIARMQEASSWVSSLSEDQRKVIRAALVYLAAGRKQVPWLKIWEAQGRGRPGPDGLRKRYGTAIAAIAASLNG